MAFLILTLRMATTIISMRKARVVRRTARMPKPKVRKEAMRCGWSGLARRRKSETIKVRRARTAADNIDQNDFGKRFEMGVDTYRRGGEQRRWWLLLRLCSRVSSQYPLW